MAVNFKRGLPVKFPLQLRKCHGANTRNAAEAPATNEFAAGDVSTDDADVSNGQFFQPRFVRAPDGSEWS